jgi:hypothetical protein
MLLTTSTILIEQPIRINEIKQNIPTAIAIPSIKGAASSIPSQLVSSLFYLFN